MRSKALQPVLFQRPLEDKVERGIVWPGTEIRFDARESSPLTKRTIKVAVDPRLFRSS
jgi:hypothetical protein